ncbi:MAG: acyltransferase [Anaerolineales bacterium]
MWERLQRLWMRLSGELTVTGELSLDALVKRGLTVGRDCHIGQGVSLDPAHCWHIVIGDEVTIAPNVHILAHDASTKRHLGYTRIGKVHIGQRVFLGAGVIVLPNVTIGDNSIIGAGSVVTHDVPANVVAAGNPARVITTLEAYLRRSREQFAQLPRFDARYTVAQNITPAMQAEMNRLLTENEGFVE